MEISGYKALNPALALSHQLATNIKFKYKIILGYNLVAKVDKGITRYGCQFSNSFLLEKSSQRYVIHVALISALHTWSPCLHTIRDLQAFNLLITHHWSTLWIAVQWCSQKISLGVQLNNFG